MPMLLRKTVSFLKAALIISINLVSFSNTLAVVRPYFSWYSLIKSSRFF